MTRLAASIRGRATDPLILLGPALGTTSAIWDDTIATLLEHGFQVGCYDHWGHGASPDALGPFTPAGLAHDILRLADAAGAGRFCYAGISLGGSLGLVIAAIAPARVQRLVLISTLPSVGKPEEWESRARAIENGGSVAALAPAVLARWLSSAYISRAVAPAQRLQDDLAATSPRAYAAYCRMAAHMDLTPLLTRVAAPTLVISGALDPATPAADQTRMAHALPHARQALIGEAAHLVCVERGREVARLLAEHAAC